MKHFVVTKSELNICSLVIIAYIGITDDIIFSLYILIK